MHGDKTRLQYLQRIKFMSTKLDGSKLVDLVSSMPSMEVPMVQLPRRWKVVEDGDTSHVVLNDLNLSNMLADVGVVKNLSADKSLPLLQDVKVSVKNGKVVGVQERRLTLVAVGRGDFSFTNVPKEEWREALEEMESVAEMDHKFLTRFNDLFGDNADLVEDEVESLRDEVVALEDRVRALESEVSDLQAGCDRDCSSCDEEDSDMDEDEEDCEEDDEESSTEDDTNW
jgi:hypothetical protein